MTSAPTTARPATAPPSGNVADLLRESALAMPELPAVIMPPSARRPERRISFAGLDREADRIAGELRRLGVRPGHRLVLMVRPGIEFIALTFALFRSGATVVLIDPGMGVRRVFRCLAEVDPDGFVAIPPVQIVRRLRRRLFPNARFNVTVRSGYVSEPARTVGAPKGTELPPVRPRDHAAIIFTSGGTGPPKGVVYEHGMFAAQVDMLRDRFDIRPGEIDLPAFPLFALFNAAMRVTTVVPDIDPTRPAKADPRKILEPVRIYGVTQAFGSPALWNRVGRRCEANGERIPHLRRTLSAGAPVPAQVLKRMIAAFQEPDADLHTPYGATEALPVATISAREVLAETAALSARGAGTCVGAPFPGVDLRIIERTDGAIATMADATELPSGQIGEIVVRSRSATREYYHRPHETTLAKIPDGDGFWHRMGDVGYLDAQGRLWFCGRKAHVVGTARGPMYSVCCEAIFNEHPDVYRAALVGVGPEDDRTPVIVVEPEAGRFPRGRRRREAFTSDLRRLAASNPLTQSIGYFLFHRSFPVDVRHNIKIDRDRLGRWAAKTLAIREAPR